MIRENQKLLNRLNVLSDAAVLFLAMPAAFWLRFFVLPDGVISLELGDYLLLAGLLMLAQLALFGMVGLYSSHRRQRLWRELLKLGMCSAAVLAALLSVLFLRRELEYSRITLGVYFALAVGVLAGKRIILRLALRKLRASGYNRKHVLIVGGGRLAGRYLAAIRAERELGYHAMGYLAADDSGLGVPYLGGFERLAKVLEAKQADEVIAALEAADAERLPTIIEACEGAGVRLSIVPLYAEYMSGNPQFDELGGIPLMNIRRIPLDNGGAAFCKRFGDILCSALGLILVSPILLVLAIGTKLSSPGPIIFSQKRVGRGKKEFKMYKFRSMRINDESDSAWSAGGDARVTKFGRFMRKLSLDELPQLFNVLIGDMSLVGPRPEIPFHVDRFRKDVPLYMVKHQVRPGMTGWAQVCGYRGDTSIAGRIEHDIYYIEHWTPFFDIKILVKTVFGAFITDEGASGAGANDEVVSETKGGAEATAFGRGAGQRRRRDASEGERVCGGAVASEEPRGEAADGRAEARPGGRREGAAVERGGAGASSVAAREAATSGRRGDAAAAHVGDVRDGAAQADRPSTATSASEASAAAVERGDEPAHVGDVRDGAAQADRPSTAASASEASAAAMERGDEPTVGAAKRGAEASGSDIDAAERGVMREAAGADTSEKVAGNAGDLEEVGSKR